MAHSTSGPPEFIAPGESFWNSPRMSPSSESVWTQNHPFSTETIAVETSCPIQNISHLIDSCAKARFVAVMALELLVFDGKLHGSRRNWACPFGDCKENFPDAKRLMRHVPSCPHFTDSKVYCNNCNGRDCFPIRGDCRDGLGDEGVAQNEVEPTKKRKTIRKITSIISRSLPGSRPSSRTSGCANVPTSSPKLHFPECPPESSEQGQTVSSGSGAAPLQEMDTTPPLCELPGTTATPHELPTPEQSAPTYVTGGTFTESPVEDLTMETRIPGWGPMSNNTSAASYPTGLPQGQPTYATASWLHSPALEMGWKQQQSHEFTQQTVSPLSTPGVGGGMYSFPDASVSNYGAPYSNIGEFELSLNLQDSTLQQAGPPWQPSTPTHSRAWHGSGDTWLSATSSNTLVSQRSERQPLFRKCQEPGSSSPVVGPATSQSLAFDPASVTAFAGADSQPVATEDLICPYPTCDYRPSGKRSGWHTYLKKHIAKHRASKIPCPDCGKEISRKDNLKTHQKNSCPKRLLAAILPQSPGRPLAVQERETGHALAMRRNYPCPRRLREDRRKLRKLGAEAHQVNMTHAEFSMVMAPKTFRNGYLGT